MSQDVVQVKTKYITHVKELYDKGYRFIVKVTNMTTNESYLLADNPSGLFKTSDCVDWFDVYDGINHFTREQALKICKEFEESHLAWCAQPKEISFDKK